MRGMHESFLLRQHVEHKDTANLAVHVWTSAIAWLAIITIFSQVGLPIAQSGVLANCGAVFLGLSLLYWLSVDLVIVAAIASLSAAWMLMPWSPWGPGHGWLAGVIAPLAVLAATRIVERFSHIYYHERAAFLRGEPKLRAFFLRAHAVVWAPFHAWLLHALHRGYRPQLKAELDALEREVLRSREHVPWVNWAGTASCHARFISVPQSVSDLIQAMKDAHQRGQRVRIVASGFSWTSLVSSDESLIFCERLDAITIDNSDPAHPFVWCEAGVTNRQLNRALERVGLCMPWNVVLETVRVAGLVTTGTHGTGKHTATVGDLVEAVEVIDAAGRLRTLSIETVGRDVMSAVRLSLGLLGVIARVRLRVVPMYRVRQTDQRLPAKAVLAQLDELVANHDSVELYWFPFNSDVWMRTIDRTEQPRTFRGHGFWFRAQNLLQNCFLVLFSTLINRFAPSLTPALLRVGLRMLPFSSRVVNLPESHHYHHWIEMMPCGCMEVGFKADPDYANVRRAWQVAERMVADYARRDLFPLNLSLNMRFIGTSDALLTPAYGEGTTCYIEIMWRGRPKGWVEFTSELCRQWLKVPGALPHWSKEFEHISGIVPIVRENLGDRRERFLSALAASGLDPEQRFFNPLTRRILTDEVAESLSA
jgi:D-arabinono-1,4-lactone oxidase/FAD binding domain